jgi:hypothetical protein
VARILLTSEKATLTEIANPSYGQPQMRGLIDKEVVLPGKEVKSSRRNQD